MTSAPPETPTNPLGPRPMTRMISFARKTWTWAVGVTKLAWFTWRRRHVASHYELVAIRKGTEFEDYVVARNDFDRKAFVAWLLRRQEEPAEAAPVDLDEAWREMQKRGGVEL